MQSPASAASIADLETEISKLQVLSRLTRVAVCYAFVALTAGLLVACGGGGGGGGGTASVTVTPPSPPLPVTVTPPPPPLPVTVTPPPPFERPVVTANGQPVEGIHYIRADDDSRMRESELTDAEGRINPRLPDNTESAQIIFAVGPITLATVRNGIRIFDFDTENGGFEIGRVSRPTRGWSGIDLLSRDLPECTDCDNYKRYLASLIPNANPEAPPNGLTVSRFLRPRVMYRSIENPEDTYPVAGIHYIQQDDIQLTISALTTVDGSFDGLFFDASPDATTVRSMPIIFAVGSINRVRHDPMPSSIVYDYQNDGFPLGTLTVTSAPRDWHNATIWIQKSSEGDLLFIGPNARITITTIAGTDDGDKRLLASLVDGEDGGKEISLFVRPRFFYEGAAVQSAHYLRALDDEMTISRRTTETVAMDPTPRQLGAFDVLLTINDEYDDPPAMTVGEIFASEEILFALGGATAVYDSSGVPTYSFDGDSGHVSLATVPAAGQPWSGRVVSITHDEGNRLLAESGPATVAIEDETTIKRFLVGVGDGVSGEDRIIDLFTPPRIMHRRDSSGAPPPNPLANIHYIRVHASATVRHSLPTDDNGSFDPLILRRDPHSLYVEKSATMHFGVGSFTRDAADLCRFQSTLKRNGFEPGEGGGFEMGETERTDGDWSGESVFVEPGDSGLGSDFDACDGLPSDERARLFVASLGDNPAREKGLLVTPFLYPRFLHGGEPTQNVDYIRVDDEGNPTMTVSIPTDENGFFDPLQISVYDKDDIQIEQMLFGLGVISVMSSARGGYAFDDPAYGFQIGTAMKEGGWSGRDIEIDAPSYQLVPLAGTTIDPDDIARFRTYNTSNPERKVAEINSPGVPRLDLANLPNLIYDDGSRDKHQVSGVHYIRVGDPQMRASLPTDKRGGFVPTGATVGIVGTVLFATREIVADIDRVNMTIGYRVQEGTFLGAVTLGAPWDGRGLEEDHLDLWRDKNYEFSDLTGVLPSEIFVGGKTPTRIDYLAFEFFIDGPDSDKYPRFHYDGAPLSRLHYYARPAAADAARAVAGVTRPNGIFDPLHNGKEVGTVYFATAPIAVANGAPSFAPTSFIGAYTVAVDEDILTSEFRSEVLTFVDLVSLDGVPKRVDWLVLDLFAGRADKLPRLHYNDAPVANIHYLRDGAFQSEPILDDGFFNPIGNGGGEATPVYFATSPIKVENGNPVFASKTFLGAIASSLATDSDPETSDFREMTLGFDELEDYGGNSRPDPLILERALGIASYPRLLYGVSDGYTPDESNVIGLHYMRVGDGDMDFSEPTDENGRFDPIMTDGRQAGMVIFGYRAFEFDGVEYQFQEESIGDEFNVGFQVGAASVSVEIPGNWRNAVLNLGYADSDRYGEDWRQLALANTELTLNALCRLHDRGTRGDKGWNFGEDDNINPQNPTRLRRGDVDGDYIHGIYYRRLNDEFFSLPQSTSEDGYVLPYRFDEAKNICVRDELVFSVGEEEIVGGEYVLKEENNLVGYDRFYVGHLSESDTDVDLEISDLGPLPSSALLSPPRPENYEERLGFVLVRQSGHNTRWETAPPLFLEDENGDPITNRALYYYFESEGKQYKTGPNGEIRVASKSGSKSQILPRGTTTIHFSLSPFEFGDCENNANTRIVEGTPVSSGAVCVPSGDYLGYLVDPDSHSNPVRRLIITGSLDDLMSGLFPPIFVDAPVAGISYLPIFDGDDDSPQLVSVSNLSESGGGFRPNGASQVLFALGAISLSSGGPIESSLSFGAHLLPVLFANDFEATITIAGTARTVMFQKGVSVVEIPNAGGMSVRQLTLNTDDIVALGVAQRPLEGWARAVFTPHDLGAFAHQSDSIVGSHIGAARFLQMLDPDFPREEIVSGVQVESPPEDQEIVISTLAVSWLTETPGLNILSEKEAKATCGDNTTGCESIYNSAISLVYLFRLATGDFQFRMSRQTTSAFELVPGDTPDGDMDLGSGQGKSFASSEFLNGVGYIYPGAETTIAISVSGQTLTLTVPSKSDAEKRLAQGVALVMDRIAPPPFRSDSPDDITLAVSSLSVMFPYGIADRPAARISLADAYSGEVTFDEKTGEIRFPNIREELLLPEDVEYFNSLDVMMNFSYGSGSPVSRRIRFRLSDDSPHATP